MEYYTAVKMNCWQAHITKQMNLTDNIMSKRSQTQNSTSCDSIEFKNKENKLMFM